MKSSNGPYTMQININNKTDNTLKYRGAAFYDEDGDVKSSPKDIPPKSTGDGGALEKVGGSDGLFGLVAYTTPDPAQILVIYIEMPAGTGKLNHCFVGMTNAGRAINDALANDCYNRRLNPFTEGLMSWSFTQDSQEFLLTVKPRVDDPKGYNTFTDVQVDLYKKSSP